MKKKHLDFIAKFHKSTSRHLYTLRDGGVEMKVTIILISLFLLSGCGSQYNIDLSSCNPSGIYQNVKENVSPKKFWVDVHTKLDMEINFWGLPSPSSVCSGYSGKKRSECISVHKNKFDSMRRCLNHSRKMCRLNGGYC
tara:strand:- start:80 stop:496 length:417 start_codon:yes stop_codon:yes gene_type:complete